MLVILINLHMILQLAKCSNAAPSCENILEYFSDIIVPAIAKWQLEPAASSSTLSAAVDCVSHVQSFLKSVVQFLSQD